MKNLCKIITLCAICIYAHPSVADTIYLKSGEKIEGHIIASSNKSIMVKSKNGEYKTYVAQEIEKVEKGPDVTIEDVAVKVKPEDPKKRSILKDIARRFSRGKSKAIDNPKYILYILEGIDYDKRYPLVVALSPGADAQSMINAWKNVSEKHKWIILASKEFRNNIPTGEIFLYLSSIILGDLSTDFPIDKSKIIATGLSGGGMGSHMFAFYYPNLISAIVSNVGRIHPECLQEKHRYPRGKLAVFLASPTDFNYEIMKRDRIFLEELGWKTKWIEFEGGHAMAPDESYQKAAQWLEENFPAINLTSK